MEAVGGNLTQLTYTDVEEENAVWGLNGIDVVYSVNDRTWEAANVITGAKLFGFEGVARGRYVIPVLAATGHLLIPTQVAIEEKKGDEKGYVDQDWLKARPEKEPGNTIASSSSGAQSRRGYRITTSSKDSLVGIRHKIYTAFTRTPIYQSDVGGYVPPTISWP